MEYSEDQMVTLATNLTIKLIDDGKHLKNPPKYTPNQIGERVFDRCSDINGDLTCTDENYQMVIIGVTRGLEIANRLGGNTQGEGYNIWMRSLKWLLSPKNEQGFGARCYRQCKELQNLLGWNDEQMKEVSGCFDKLTLENGNTIYRGVDANDVYRDNTSNQG